MSASGTKSEQALHLLGLLKQRSLLVGDITLSSGEASKWYVDGKMVAVFPESAFLIGECFCDELEGVAFDALGGQETGAIPIIASFASAWYRRNGANIEGFWVRNQPKKHGTQKLIEGKLERGSRVVIVDDVVTTGGSVKKAVAAAEQQDCTVVKIRAMVDRNEGGREALSEYDYDWLFSKEDFDV